MLSFGLQNFVFGACHLWKIDGPIMLPKKRSMFRGHVAVKRRSKN